MSANWSKKYGRYAADSDDADAEADHLVEVLRHPKSLAYLSGLIDGRLRALGEGEGDARAAKTRAEGRALVNSIMSPTRNLMAKMPEAKELLELSAKAKGAPKEYVASVKSRQKELGQ